MRSKNLCKRIGMLLLAAVVSLVTSAQVWAQQTITGTIVDQTGEPVMGATVLVKGTTNGSTTDLDGRYSIPNVSSNQVLAVSFIGYASQEIPVGNRTVIDITLLEDSELLEDVVVVGYGVQRKSNLTGAISSVKSGDIENRTVVDVNQSLQGKTAGVQMISSSAAPGTESSIRVRGFSSNSTSNPLYVVDGVRVNSIVNIDPSDIESMEVLKDAASAAIYGAEAGNGVILITTKRGAKAEGIGKISYNAQFAIQSLGRKAEVMNADQYLAYNLKSGGIGESLAKEWDGTDINWCDELFETSLMQKHSVNFQNGNDKGNVYISFNYTGNDGIVKTDKDTYKRFAGSVNAEYNIKPWLQISSQNSVTYHAQNSLAENDPYVSVLRAALALDPLTKNTYPENNLPKNMQELLDNGRKLVSDGEGNYYGISKFQLGDDINPYILINTRSQRTWGTFTQGNTADFMPSLRPETDLIYYSAVLPGTNNAPFIWNRPLNGGMPEQLTEGSQPQWSPDGKKLLYVKGSLADNKCRIWICDPDGSNQTLISSGSGDFNDIDPRWSNDSSKIIFASNRSIVKDRHNYDIYIMDADGGNLTQLTTNSSHDDKPVFAPDGKTVFFRSNRGLVWDIWTMKIN